MSALVGGVVGLVGGLGGFVLPIAFGALNDLTGVWQSCFWLLFALVDVGAGLDASGDPQHGDRAQTAGELRTLPELPGNAADPRTGASRARSGPRARGLAARGRRSSGSATGRRIARRNLWISVPCLLLSFAVWMVWSVVVAKLPAVGFAFTNDQLFWLAALPGLSGCDAARLLLLHAVRSSAAGCGRR